MVTSSPVRATAIAWVTAARNAGSSAITWSAANEPRMMSGSRRSRTAAARPIAAIESRGAGLGQHRGRWQLGELAGHRVGVHTAGDDQHPIVTQFGEPVPGRPQQ